MAPEGLEICRAAQQSAALTSGYASSPRLKYSRTAYLDIDPIVALLPRLPRHRGTPAAPAIHATLCSELCSAPSMSRYSSGFLASR